MSIELTELASKLGIELSTLKPEGVTYLNTYLSEADTKYSQATAAQQAAEAKLAQVQEEQRVIDQNIANFGMTEANVAALRANNAAMEASLKALQEQGFKDIKIPDPVAAAAKVDPAAEFNTKVVNGFATMGQALNAMARYQRTFNKPMPDDPVALAEEAAANRMSVDQWAQKKYDFAGEEKKQAEAKTAAQKAEWEAAAVTAYKEANPNNSGHPDLARGVQSRHPLLARKSETIDRKQFANLNPAQKIARSVARTTAALAANQ